MKYAHLSYVQPSVYIESSFKDFRPVERLSELRFIENPLRFISFQRDSAGRDLIVC